MTLAAQGQTYQVIYNFTGGDDGGAPYGGLTIDALGNLYGTTCGNFCDSAIVNDGTVFRLRKNGSGWSFDILHTFSGGNDGSAPSGRVVFGPDKNLYGTTAWGGGNGCYGSGSGAGCGTVFVMVPPTAVAPNAVGTHGAWGEAPIYRFQGGTDGANPELGDVIFDAAGNLYGTSSNATGGASAGTVYQLARSSHGWTMNVLYQFSGGNDGGSPIGTLVLAPSGLLYGTTLGGGAYSGGTVFQLAPTQSGWVFTNLYNLKASQGQNPIAGVIVAGGSMVVSASTSGPGNGGAMFIANNDLFDTFFAGGNYDYPGPYMTPTGSETNLYDTTHGDGAYYYGSVFQLQGCAGWGYTSLYDFTGGTDGANPISNVVFDTSGNLYGTTSAGGAYGHGVIFEITPDSNNSPQCRDSQ
jgi:uncharacterized repeat protein (TIGR03803 family)